MPETRGARTEGNIQVNTNIHNMTAPINFNMQNQNNAQNEKFTKMKDKQKKMVFNDLQNKSDMINRSSRSGSENRFMHLPEINKGDNEE